MRFLRNNTACRITVGPFVDATDGTSPEVSLTVTSEKLTLMVDTANVPTLVLDVAPTASGGANDMVHVTGDDAGFYDLELAAANVNYFGRAILAITNAAHRPVVHEFMIIPGPIYDVLILGIGTLPLLSDLSDDADVAAAVHGELVPGSYGAGTHGKLVGDNLNATVGSRASQTTADSVKTKTDQLAFGVANRVNANVTHINEIEVGGDGESGTEWGPV